VGPVLGEVGILY